MLFNSIDFLLFFSLICLIFRNLPSQKSKSYLLLGASLFFYGYWKAEYLLLLLATSFIDFELAKKIGGSDSPLRRKIWLVVSLISNISNLIFFKYGLFLAKNLSQFHAIDSIPDWIQVVLPLGISFYTFQAMGYVIDVFRKRIPAQTNFSEFLLFITFFPQLVAGPIERATHLIGQLKNFSTPTTEKLVTATGLICLGFWKKLFIADRLGVFVDGTFNNASEASGIQCVVGTIFFGFQIYCDFSGYSDMARGLARFFGIQLMLNFNKPYLALNLTDFWRRWHISLSGWFRDYLYYPLGGAKNGIATGYRNILIVFIISGIWHGANWTFALWGLWHGLGLVVERILGFSKNPGSLYRFITLFWVFIGWIFFRANSLADASLIVQNILELKPGPWSDFNLYGSDWELLMAVLGILSLALYEIFQTRITRKLLVLNPEKQAGLIVIAFLILIWVGKFKGQDFIYFQF